ncbi:patatin-like protein 2 [Dorcoceras hygrometricum]|uniref:Patatin-like protein 2 n=1 Tax=Dorcoceras hygrometricum TaxID=472368 RepID=A0A2Z7AET2_9LAMI|nr:patatin-like protein 2 [Dorcoceras hygrometricum]
MVQLEKTEWWSAPSGAQLLRFLRVCFATAFDLPTEGLTDFSDVPKNIVFDARILFSESKEQVSISCLKKELKIQYRLLHDILEKTIYVKAGSFDVVTRDRFMLMTAITCDVKVNWSNLLFSVFKDMVTPGTRQAKGFAIQISVLLKNVPRLDLGESRAFPIPRVLTEKTVHRFVAINEKVGVEDVTDEPRVRKTPVKKAVSEKTSGWC